MNLRSRLTGTALVLTLSGLGLAACGSDDGGAEATDTPSQAEDTSTEDSAEGEGEDGKPSKQEVIDGYTDLVGQLMGEAEIPADILDKVVTCFVDEVYDDATAQTLNAIATGDQAGVDPADTALFTEASSTCQQAAIG